jgi:hypothetical protein
VPSIVRFVPQRTLRPSFEITKETPSWPVVCPRVWITSPTQCTDLAVAKGCAWVTTPIRSPRRSRLRMRLGIGVTYRQY